MNVVMVRAKYKAHDHAKMTYLAALVGVTIPIAYSLAVGGLFELLDQDGIEEAMRGELKARLAAVAPAKPARKRKGK